MSAFLLTYSSSEQDFSHNSAYKNPHTKSIKILQYLNNARLNLIPGGLFKRCLNAQRIGTQGWDKIFSQWAWRIGFTKCSHVSSLDSPKGLF